MYDELNDLDEALSLYERVYKGFAASLGETHKSTLEVLGNLTVVHQQRGEVDVALTLALKALDGYRAEFGRGHILTLKAIAAVGEVHSQCEDWSTALTWFDDALKGLEDVAGAHDPETLSVCNRWATTRSTRSEATSQTEAIDMHWPVVLQQAKQSSISLF